MPGRSREVSSESETFLQRRDAVHFFTRQQSLSPIQDVQHARAGHGVAFNKIAHGVKSAFATAGFRKPFHINITPKKTGDAGSAMVAYRRAAQLSPNDPQVTLFINQQLQALQAV